MVRPTGPDVDAPPFHVEAKREKKPSPRAALAQAVADAAPGRIPVAVLRDDAVCGAAAGGLFGAGSGVVGGKGREAAEKGIRNGTQR